MTELILSVIIPCYNAGQYLPDALESVKNCMDESVYEVIIVNDGSTDAGTLDLLIRLQKEGYTVLHQDNKGPAAARNAGVRIAKGQYLLLLDSDNKIRKAYITKGIDILNNHPEVGVVHANPAFFGDTNEPRFQTGKYDLYRILMGNYIDTCAVIRKKVWDELGGQDENRLIIGHEDWDLYIRVGAAGYHFHYLDETLFDYRVLHTSLVKKIVAEDPTEAFRIYLYTKHIKLIADNYHKLYSWYLIYQHDQERPFRSFLKYFYQKYLKRS